MKYRSWRVWLGPAGLVALIAGCQPTITSLGSTGDDEACTPGNTKRADDGCNTCSCGDDGTWACTERDCPEECTPGDTMDADDGCNTCTCTKSGTWACTDLTCVVECEDGEVQPAGDGCNTCTCYDGLWACTQMACVDCVPGERIVASDGCNTCTCTRSGTWACTDMACGSDCEPGEIKDADDGCNTCTCLDNGTWACTERDCPEDCRPGDIKDAGDGCNDCICQDDGTWACTLMGCLDCVDGETKIADDGCNRCWCSDGQWACTDEECVPECPVSRPLDPETGCIALAVVAMDPASGLCCEYGSPCEAPPDWRQYYSMDECEGASTCVDGEMQPADDGCNTCVCVGGDWACTERACVPECPPSQPRDPETGCAAVMVYAQDPTSGLCCEYASPCEAPPDWRQYYSMDECEGAFVCPDPLRYDGGCEDVEVWAKDPVTGACCRYGTPCSAPADWNQYNDQETCESSPDGVFNCGDAMRCVTGEEYCLLVSGGPAGSDTSAECVAFEEGCSSCDCLAADLTSDACACRDSAGTTTVECAMP